MERDHSDRHDLFGLKQYSNLNPEILVKWIAHLVISTTLLRCPEKKLSQSFLIYSINLYINKQRKSTA